MSHPSAAPAHLAAPLDDARRLTLRLVEHLTDDDLVRQHSPLMGPIVWDLGHIAHFEALWLLRHAREAGADGRVAFGEMPGTFNPFENPRRVRGELALPTRAEALELLAETRERVRTVLPELDARTDESPLLHEGHVIHLVAQHEMQHAETILQTLQLKGGAPFAAPRAPTPAPAIAIPQDMVRFPGGRVTIGTGDRAWAYDNEREAHEVELAPFDIDRAPVTNGAFLAFVEDGGYARREWWSDEGWAWLQDPERDGAGTVGPRNWTREAGGWQLRSFDETVPLPHERPVCHVSWHEAEAYARWAGKRLPTEAEWEAAATWDPDAGRKQAFPWGDEPASPELANVGQLLFDTAPVGAYPRNVSPIGCYGMIGDCWEWTSSVFAPYPGFEAFPYPEYSVPFFDGKSRVLRGGSWATAAPVARATFRNWDYPIRRQIFAGFRCARDA